MPAAARSEPLNGEEDPARVDLIPAIQSVERAARILNFFTASRPWLTLSEITARLGMSKATAHRYAMALRQVSLLRYDPSTGQYALGPQVLVLAAAARSALPIISQAGPLMEQLVREVNETVVLSTWDGEAPVVVRVDDDTERVIRVSVRAGARLSTFASAQGRVFCSFLPSESVPALAEELVRAPKMRADLEAIREEQLAVNKGELHGVRTVAAPVFADGRIIAVMAVVGTTTTLSDDVHSPPATALRRAAGRLTDLYGRPGEDETKVVASSLAQVAGSTG